MEHDKLVKLSAKELNDRLAEINAKAKTAEGDDLKALLTEAKDIQAIIADAQARAELGEIAGRAAAQAPKGGEEGGEVVDKVRSARGEQLKAGKHVTYKATARPDSIKATLSTTQTRSSMTFLPWSTASTRSRSRAVRHTSAVMWQATAATQRLQLRTRTITTWNRYLTMPRSRKRS